jgi:putative transposase
MKKRFSVEQIVAVLKQAELGVPVTEVIRKVEISEQTFYRWKTQYVGMETDRARQLKQLVAGLSLDKTMLQGVLRKSSRAFRGCPTVDHLREHYRTSVRHACQVLLMVRGTYRYQSHRELWTELRKRIREICVLLTARAGM